MSIILKIRSKIADWRSYLFWKWGKIGHYCMFTPISLTSFDRFHLNFMHAHYIGRLLHWFWICVKGILELIWIKLDTNVMLHKGVLAVALLDILELNPSAWGMHKLFTAKLICMSSVNFLFTNYSRGMCMVYVLLIHRPRDFSIRVWLASVQ